MRYYRVSRLDNQSDPWAPRLYTVPSVITPPSPRGLLFLLIRQKLSRLSRGISHHICYYLSIGTHSLRATLWDHFADSQETCHHWPMQCPMAWHSFVQGPPAQGGDGWRWRVSGNGSSPRPCISVPKGRGRLWPWSESLTTESQSWRSPEGSPGASPFYRLGGDWPKVTQSIQWQS